MKPEVQFLAIGTAMLLFLNACSKSEQGAPSAPSASKSPIASAVVTTGGPVELKAKWPVGNKYTYRMDMAQKFVFKMAGKPMEQNVTISQTYSLTPLKEREGGGREVELEFVAMEMDFKMGEMTMSFDSKSDSDAGGNPFAGVFKKVMGSKLAMLLDGKGQMESIPKYQEWKDSISEGSNPMTQGMLQGMYSEDTFKQLVGGSAVFPDRALKPGETWPHKMEVGAGPLGKLAIDLQLTLKGMEARENHQCARIESTGTLKSGGSGEAGPMGKMTIQEGTLKGVTWFDTELGAMIESASDQFMKFKMEPPDGAPAPPGAAGGMSADMSQKITVKLVELAKAK
ncbi:MAG: hypothetical protein EXS31_09775 [Pedosphaera sp.]|nr:hypothetical protein [Pedosphaera sp.]